MEGESSRNDIFLRGPGVDGMDVGLVYGNDEISGTLSEYRHDMK